MRRRTEELRRGVSVGSARIAADISAALVRRALAMCATVAALAFSAPAGGQGAEDTRASAVVIFDEARSLMKAERFEEACAKFAEALALSRGVGIQFHLAQCYERTGRLASAWTHFVEVADATRARGETERQRVAEQHASALARRLTRLVIAPVDPPPDLAVSRSGMAVTRGQWSTAIPVDPGLYRIEARAVGRVTWWRDVAVEGEGKTIRVEVPRLAASPPELPPRKTGSAVPRSKAMPDASGAHRGLRIAGIVGVSLGAAALVTGGVLGGLALAEKDAAFEARDGRAPHCIEPLSCDDEGRQQIESARALSYGSTAAFVAGGVLAATGVVVLITTWPTGPKTARIGVRPLAGGFLVDGSF